MAEKLADRPAVKHAVWSLRCCVVALSFVRSFHPSILPSFLPSFLRSFAVASLLLLCVGRRLPSDRFKRSGEEAARWRCIHRNVDVLASTLGVMRVSSHLWSERNPCSCHKARRRQDPVVWPWTLASSLRNAATTQRKAMKRSRVA